MSNNAIIIAIRTWTLGNPEALLDPLVYFLCLVTDMCGGGLLYLNSRTMTSFDPLADHFTPSMHKSALGDERGVHMYHMLEVEEAPNLAQPRQTPSSQRHRWWTASCLERCNRISREEHKMGALCPRFVQTNPDKETQQGRAKGAASVTCANNL